jgi:hypothetical protein
MNADSDIIVSMHLVIPFYVWNHLRSGLEENNAIPMPIMTLHDNK